MPKEALQNHCRITASVSQWLYLRYMYRICDATSWQHKLANLGLGTALHCFTWSYTARKRYQEPPKVTLLLITGYVRTQQKIAIISYRMSMGASSQIQSAWCNKGQGHRSGPSQGYIYILGQYSPCNITKLLTSDLNLCCIMQTAASYDNQHILHSYVNMYELYTTYRANCCLLW